MIDIQCEIGNELQITRISFDGNQGTAEDVSGANEYCRNDSNQRSTVRSNDGVKGPKKNQCSFNLKMLYGRNNKANNEYYEGKVTLVEYSCS